jgi:xanthine dehydrogenase YagT iron-sulfur-binding subunit
VVRRVVLNVNGEEHGVGVQADGLLVDVLRNDLGLLGTKFACGEGACGACAVLVDGRPVVSCLTLAAAAEGHKVVTIEGISSDRPTALQEAFVTEDALQCGYCTPGQIVTATALLESAASVTSELVRQELAGNLCRCGAYLKIERAILRAAGVT